MTWIKFIILFIVGLHINSSLVAQEVIIAEPRVYHIGSKCEGDTFTIGDFECVHQIQPLCNSKAEYILEDRSDQIEITGASVIRSNIVRTYKSADQKHDIKIMSYTFKATLGTEAIAVTTRSLYEYNIPEDCNQNPKNQIQEIKYIYLFTVIPKPPTPSLKVERYISANVVNLIASGCPTGIEGYDYQWNEEICLEQPNKNFIVGSKDGERQGAGGVNYRVRCRANSACFSEASEFKIGLTYTPPDLSCVPSGSQDQINKIENIKATDSNPTYHNYHVETEICNSLSDPNCTIQNVFNILLSSNQYIAPITSDMRSIGPNNNLYSYDNIAPVKSCEIVNLSGPFIRLLLDSGVGYIAKIIPNPIMTYIDYPNHSIINYTLPTHILASGRIIRQVVQRCGKIYVSTIGEGISDNSFLCEACDVACLGCLILAGKINASEGKNLFEKVDVRVKNEYIRRHQ